MQIAADINKIRKPVQRDLTLIFEAFLGSAIGFVLFLVS